MVRRTSRIRIAIALTLVFGMSGCDSGVPTSKPVPTAGPATPGPTLPAGASQGGTFLTPPVEAQTVRLDTVPDPPKPSDIPGAQGPGDDELNEGETPRTPGRDGAVVEDAGETPVTPVLPPPAQGQASPTDLVFLPPRTSHTTGDRHPIAEPQVAEHGDRVFMTWNTQAAVSHDRGADFDYFTLGSVGGFATADAGLCCDQLAQYVADRDLWVWILQYRRVETDTGPNRIRIAVAKGDAGFDARRFTYWDLTAQMAGFPDSIWFDQPKIGISDRHLFLSINAFTRKNGLVKPKFQAAVVFRVALDEVTAATTIAPRAFTTATQRDASGLPLFGPTPARVARGTMYLGAHIDDSTLGIWRWPDDQEVPTFNRVTDVDGAGSPIAYPSPFPYACPRAGAANVKDSDWCANTDDRMTSAWLGPQGLGFAWNAGQNAARGFPFPFVWVVLLDETKIEACGSGECVLGNATIHNPAFAFGYAAIAPNADGDLGGVVLYGGGSESLSCAAIVRDGDTPPTRNWDMVKVAGSDVDPPGGLTGHYLGITADGDSARTWAGGCMTLQHDLIVPSIPRSTPTAVHFIRFGRRADAPQP